MAVRDGGDHGVSGRSGGRASGRGGPLPFGSRHQWFVPFPVNAVLPVPDGPSLLDQASAMPPPPCGATSLTGYQGVFTNGEVVSARGLLTESPTPDAGLIQHMGHLHSLSSGMRNTLIHLEIAADDLFAKAHSCSRGSTMINIILSKNKIAHNMCTRVFHQQSAEIPHQYQD